VTYDPLLPRPLAADGTVAIDPRTRTLTVKPAPDARAYAKVLWRDGVRAQAEASSGPDPRSATGSAGRSSAGWRYVAFLASERGPEYCYPDVAVAILDLGDERQLARVVDALLAESEAGNGPAI
jgi:hypothetical protein